MRSPARLVAWNVLAFLLAFDLVIEGPGVASPAGRRALGVAILVLLLLAQGEALILWRERKTR